MHPIAHIHRDASIGWDTVVSLDERLLEDSGDIILNLRDAWNSSQFHEDHIIERWAEGWGFSLGDITADSAVHSMLSAFVFPALDELVPEFAEAVAPLRGAEIADADLDGRLRDVLDFPVRVNGGLLRQFLCDVFDGPFSDDEELLGAILLRSAGV